MEIKRKSFRIKIIFIIFFTALIHFNHRVHADGITVTNETGRLIPIYGDKELNEPLIRKQSESDFFMSTIFLEILILKEEQFKIISPSIDLHNKSVKVEYIDQDAEKFTGYIAPIYQLGKTVCVNQSGHSIPILKENHNRSFPCTSQFLAENEEFVIEGEEDEPLIKIRKLNPDCTWTAGYIGKDSHKEKVMPVPPPATPPVIEPATPPQVIEEEPLLPHTIGTPFLSPSCPWVCQTNLGKVEEVARYGSFQTILKKGYQNFRPITCEEYGSTLFPFYNPDAPEDDEYSLRRVQEKYNEVKRAFSDQPHTLRNFVYKHNFPLLAADKDAQEVDVLLHGTSTNSTYFTEVNTHLNSRDDKLKVHVAAGSEHAQKVFQICKEAMDECGGGYKFASNQATLEALLQLPTQTNKFFTFYPPFEDEEQNNIYFAYLGFYLAQRLRDQGISIDSVANYEIKKAIQKGDGIALPEDDSQLITFRDENQSRGERRTIGDSNERERSFWNYYCNFLKSVNPKNSYLKPIRFFIQPPQFRIFDEITPESLEVQPIIAKGSFGMVKQAVVDGKTKAVKQPTSGNASSVKEEIQNSKSFVREVDGKVRESFSDEYAQKNVASLLQSKDSINTAEGQTPNGELVLPFIEGKTLGDAVKDGTYTSLDKNEKKIYLLQFLSALMAFDATGFVHGDLKNDNVMIENDGSVKIIDLGETVRTGEEGLTSQACIHGPEYRMYKIQNSYLLASSGEQKSRLAEGFRQFTELMGNPYLIDDPITATRTTDVWPAGILSLTFLFGQSGQIKAQELFYRKDQGRSPCQFMIDTVGCSKETKLLYFKTLTEQLNAGLPIPYDSIELDAIAELLSKAIVADPEQRETPTNLFDYCLQNLF
ncbi:MAG: protein kinase [Lactobacillales bacterium]|jgi:serine/threonine protein kinase|nr:protein kinase [Lactobacillales bacterium]